MEEIWKPIELVKGKYLISSEGRIKHLNRKRCWSGYVSNTGYARACIYDWDGKKYTPLIHRLVAKAFFGDLKDLEVNHKDFNPLNNRIENLELCTGAENVRHSIKAGRYLNAKKNMRKNFKRLSDRQINQIRSSESSLSNLARKFDRSHYTIWKIKKYLVYKNV